MRVSLPRLIVVFSVIALMISCILEAYQVMLWFNHAPFSEPNWRDGLMVFSNVGTAAAIIFLVCAFRRGRRTDAVVRATAIVTILAAVYLLAGGGTPLPMKFTIFYLFTFFYVLMILLAVVSVVQRLQLKYPGA